MIQIIIIIIIIFIYIAIGIYKVVSDYKVRPIDQPYYVRNPKLSDTLVVVIMWLPLLIREIREFGIRNVWEDRKRIRGRRKRAKLERTRKELTSVEDFFLNKKYLKAQKEAVEEIKKEEKRKLEPEKKK